MSRVFPPHLLGPSCRRGGFDSPRHRPGGGRRTELAVESLAELALAERLTTQLDILSARPCVDSLPLT